MVSGSRVGLGSKLASTHLLVTRLPWDMDIVRRRPIVSLRNENKISTTSEMNGAPF